MFKNDDLDQEYVDNEIEEYGKIEEYDNGISYCPYCGHANEIDATDVYFDIESIKELRGNTWRNIQLNKLANWVKVVIAQLEINYNKKHGVIL